VLLYFKLNLDLVAASETRRCLTTRRGYLCVIFREGRFDIDSILVVLSTKQVKEKARYQLLGTQPTL